LEHGLTGAAVPTKEDIIPYLHGFDVDADGWIKPVAGERYNLRCLVEVPEAELTRDLEGRPKGTRIRLLTNGKSFSIGALGETNWDCEIIRPNEGTASNAAPPHR